jgi:thymidylate kinase
MERKGEFFGDVVSALERAGHRTCVARGYRDYPEHIGPDIDIISEDPARLPHDVSSAATVVQIFEHETTFHYLCRFDDGKPVIINLDVQKDYGHRGRTLFRGEEFLKSRRKLESFHIPSADMEFASYLLRKVAQGELGEEQGRRLSGLYREDPEGSARRLARFFSGVEVELVAEAARTGDWDPVRLRLAFLRRTLLANLDRAQPLGALRHFGGVLRRRVGRVLHPPGLMVAFLGTDGAGKSTIMARVEEDLGDAFWMKKQYHKRPLSTPFRWLRRYGLRPPGEAKWEKESEAEATGFTPHALPSRGTAYSLAKLGFWWVDFVFLGYLAEFLPKLTSPNLLLFDRYYQDLLVDPRRYHYGGSMKLARFVGKLIPQPHLIIVLDAPPEVLLSRKQELPIEEVARQREAYVELAHALPNGHVVDTSMPLDEAAAEAERIILDYMAGRVARRVKSSSRATKEASS